MKAFKDAIKQTLKALLPAPLLNWWRRRRQQDRYREYRDLPMQELFSRIYADGTWGKSDDPSQPFFSGLGSHNSEVVTAYIAAVGRFLGNLPTKPSVVDLGCGDFYVGAHLRPLCGKYIACDIVPSLIAFNQQKFAGLDVDFRVLDLTRDALPPADVVCIRQVFQHLSNAHIANVLPALATTYRHIILTEHLPSGADFPHNLDKPAGPDTRRRVGSGVVLTSPPFNFVARTSMELCRADESNSVIVTTLYSMH